MNDALLTISAFISVLCVGGLFANIAETRIPWLRDLLETGEPVERRGQR